MNRVALFNLRTNRPHTAQQNADAFVRAVPRMVQFLDNHSPPFIAKVFMDGTVKMLFDL